MYLLLGMTPREGFEPQDTFYESIHPDDRARILESSRRLIGGGTNFSREIRILRADDGRQRWLASRGSVDRDENGELRLLLFYPGKAWDRVL